MPRAPIAHDPAIAHLLAEASNKRMEAILDAWDAQIEADFERLREQGQKLAQQKLADADVARRRQYAQIEADRSRLFAELAHKQGQAAADAALSQSIVTHLEGLAEQAVAGDVAISIPSGVRIASSSLIGPALSQLNDLVEDLASEIADGDDSVIAAQRSAAWALSQGFAPHGADLAQLLDTHGLDAAFEQRFREVSAKLDATGNKQFGHGQLKGALAHERLDHLAHHVAALRGYGSDRLIKLVSAPKSLAGSASPALPTMAPKTSMAPAAFNQMMDGLFGKPS